MVGMVAYRLALPLSLLSVHVVFYVSMLRKCTPDPTHVVDWGELVVGADRTFEEGPVRIMNRWEHVLQGKTMRLVKVLCQHRGVEEATWERKYIVRANYFFSYLRRKVCFISHWISNDCVHIDVICIFLCV